MMLLESLQKEIRIIAEGQGNLANKLDQLNGKVEGLEDSMEKVKSELVAI